MYQRQEEGRSGSVFRNSNTTSAHLAESSSSGLSPIAPLFRVSPSRASPSPLLETLVYSYETLLALRYASGPSH